MSLTLAFCSYEVNPIVNSLYVHACVRFTSLRTGLFNQVRWLHASHDITVDIAAVIKLGVDFFSKYRERIVENKRGDMEE